MTSLVPLGDQAALAYFADESAALRFAAAVRRDAPPWLVDVFQASASVAVFFDLDRPRFADVAGWLRQVEEGGGEVPTGRLHRIPCCYEMQLDLGRVAGHTGLPAEEVIRLHAAAEYT